MHVRIPSAGLVVVVAALSAMAPGCLGEFQTTDGETWYRCDEDSECVSGWSCEPVVGADFSVCVEEGEAPPSADGADVSAGDDADGADVSAGDGADGADVSAGDGADGADVSAGDDADVPAGADVLVTADAATDTSTDDDAGPGGDDADPGLEDVAPDIAEDDAGEVPDTAGDADAAGTGDAVSDDDVEDVAVAPSCEAVVCGDNASCVMVAEEPTCLCDDGWVGDGQVCEDVDECVPKETSPCDQEHGTCTNTPGSFVCDCLSGWQKDGEDGTSCVDVDECAAGTDDCDDDHGFCINESGSYVCDCTEGWAIGEDGKTCFDIDECLDPDSHDCDPVTETCLNTAPFWTCECAAGWDDDGGDPGACVNVDECAEEDDDCSANALCTDTPGAFECACHAGYSGDGKTCDAVACPDHGTAGEANASCACDAGYAGDIAWNDGTDTWDGVCTNVDECVEGGHDCHVDAACTDTEGSWTCACNPGFSGNGVLCEPVECPAAATAGEGNASCTCDEGWVGTIGWDEAADAWDGACANVDECADGGHDCHADATCTDTAGSWICACNVGFGGSGVACDEIACPADSTAGPDNSSCTCNQGYDGTVTWEDEGDAWVGTCANVDECADGGHDCHGNATCTDTVGSWTCACDVGWAGDGVACTSVKCPPLSEPGVDNSGCTCKSGYAGTVTWDEGTEAWLGTCDNVDECADGTDDCDDDHGTCQDTMGSWSCGCEDGWEPDADPTVCLNIDECALETDDCDDDRELCNDTDGSFECVCAPGWLLDEQSLECENIDECAAATHDCDTTELGTCTDLPGAWQCGCVEGYAPEEETNVCVDIDECVEATHDCEAPHWACSNTLGAFECVCAPGWAEEDCLTCVRYADPVGGGDALSWDAAASIRLAVESAEDGLGGAVEWCEVWVMAGNHDLTVDPDGKNGVDANGNVAIYGGFVGGEGSRADRNDDPSLTVLTATGAGDALKIGVRINNGPLLNGLTITGVNTGEGGSTGAVHAGGGGDPVIENCIISGNTAPASAAVVCSGVDMTIRDTLIADNVATDPTAEGGAMYVSGGSATVFDTVFEDNHSAGKGGAIHAHGSWLDLDRVEFVGNSSVQGGGAVQIRWQQAPSNIRDCTFAGNVAGGAGGGLYITNDSNNPATHKIDGCVFVGNSANEGGGLELWDGSLKADVTNCTFAYNVAALEAAGLDSNNLGDGALTNSIIWGNSAPSHPQIREPETMTFDSCLIEGGYNGDPLILDADPNFAHMPLVAERLFLDGTTTTFLVSDESAWLVDDVIEFGLSGEAHVITENDGGLITFAPPHDPAPEERMVVWNWGPDEEDLAWDARLTFGSPAIDAGNDDEAEALDHDGKPRYDDPDTANRLPDPEANPSLEWFSDLGAFEYQGSQD